jgi:hypothetical protein
MAAKTAGLEVVRSDDPANAQIDADRFARMLAEPDDEAFFSLDFFVPCVDISSPFR